METRFLEEKDATASNKLNVINPSNVFVCQLHEITANFSRKAIHQSLKEHGFFFLINPVEIPQNVIAEANNFFNLTNENKAKYTASRSNQYLGYRGIGTEKSVLTGAPEQCEQFKFGYFLDKRSKTSLFRQDYLSAYKDIFKKHTLPYFKFMEVLVTDILSVIAENFNLGEKYFRNCCTEPMHQMGLNYYPVNSADHSCSQNYTMSAHKDLCLLTVIAQNKAGLMLQNLQGEWKLIPNIPNMLLIMAGDYLERWTNDYYLSPVHQVLAPSGKARTSIIYKHRPNYETVIPVIQGINPEKEHEVRGEFHTGKAYEKKITNIMENSVIGRD